MDLQVKIVSLYIKSYEVFQLEIVATLTVRMKVMKFRGNSARNFPLACNIDPRNVIVYLYKQSTCYWQAVNYVERGRLFIAHHFWELTLETDIFNFSVHCYEAGIGNDVEEFGHGLF
jgi:hypothetical protein